ncbi:hypothetical protein AAC691_15440 [Nguyenibacter vanlangensis]|uniref:Uncharacterized protein n=1 Tax=Nguyenibacter vanlangensis TaxID=1216886 RepID=A0ABZ3D1N5_9PROT
MTETVFNVGSTGKTRGGYDYVVTAIDPTLPANMQMTAKITSLNITLYYYVSGQMNFNLPDAYDLMAPVS